MNNITKQDLLDSLNALKTNKIIENYSCEDNLSVDKEGDLVNEIEVNVFIIGKSAPEFISIVIGKDL